MNYQSLAQGNNRIFTKYSVVIFGLVLTSLLVGSILLYSQDTTATKTDSSISYIEDQQFKLRALFNDWTSTYKTEYKNEEEYEYRLKIFTKNYEYIQRHNLQDNITYELALNEFADLTEDEFRVIYLSKQQPVREKTVVRQDDVDINELPVTYDHRESGIVGKVKNQGRCGSCWAFSAVTSLESVYAQKYNKQLTFSEQQLVDCSGSYGNHGCSGGEETFAFQYFKDIGIELEQDYPYKGVNQKCTYETSKIAIKTKGYVDVETKDNDQALAALSKRVVSAGVYVNANFQFYSKGVFNDQTCRKYGLNHAVALVGWGEENNQKYWILRNSWGSGWGESGYMRIQRESGLSPGICGVAVEINYPVLE